MDYYSGHGRFIITEQVASYNNDDLEFGQATCLDGHEGMIFNKLTTVFALFSIETTRNSPLRGYPGRPFPEIAMQDDNGNKCEHVLRVTTGYDALAQIKHKGRITSSTGEFRASEGSFGWSGSTF